ncbi:MAG: hypothetical protein NC193_09965, partial [bacterium]|nr:hypothetical protein [bacterium]
MLAESMPVASAAKLFDELLSFSASTAVAVRTFFKSSALAVRVLSPLASSLRTNDIDTVLLPAMDYGIF